MEMRSWYGLHQQRWLQLVAFLGNHPLHDMQAVAGADCNISLISVVEAQVIGLLTGKWPRHAISGSSLSAAPGASIACWA